MILDGPRIVGLAPAARQPPRSLGAAIVNRLGGRRQVRLALVLLAILALLGQRSSHLYLHLVGTELLLAARPATSRSVRAARGGSLLR